MIRDLGIVQPGTTLYVPFHTFDSNDPTASVTLTGLATTDIEVFKDGGTTQRASDSGYALLDTDGIDFDGITGVHGISINLADNTTAGFYAAGSRYWVVISSVTVDAATINFVLCTFSIGQPAAILNTTIATLSSQTSFTLTAGPAENDALNGCIVRIHDVASAVQAGFAVVSDYTGSTKTVTLVAGTTFTAAATDNISVFPPTLTPTVPGRTVDVAATGEVGLDFNNVLSSALITLHSVTITNATIFSGAITATNASNDLSGIDVKKISGSTEAADRLERSALAIVTGTVGAASSTTSVVSSACSPSGAALDQFKGRIMIFDKDTTTAALRGQATDITGSSNAATPTFTVTALSTAPASGDTFTIT